MAAGGSANERLAAAAVWHEQRPLWAALRIAAADCYDNLKAAGGDAFTVTLTKPGMANVFGKVLDRSDGTYDGSYNVTVRGQWTLHVKTGGVPAGCQSLTASCRQAALKNAVQTC